MSHSLPPLKRCPMCGAYKRLRARNFVFTTRDGKRLYKNCRVCDRKRQRLIRAQVSADPVRAAHRRKTKNAAQKRRWAADPEKYRRYQSEWRARLKEENPQRYVEIFLIPRRFARRKHEDRPAQTPARYEAYKKPTNAEMVSADPLRQFLLDAFPGWEEREIIAILGDSVSRHAVENVLRGQDRIQLDMADRLLTGGLGRPDLLDVLYPDETA
jgi:hypothetical protein